MHVERPIHWRPTIRLQFGLETACRNAKVQFLQYIGECSELPVAKGGSLFDLAMVRLLHTAIEFGATPIHTKRRCRANADDDGNHGRKHREGFRSQHCRNPIEEG